MAKPTPKNPPVDFLLITALEEERDALLRYLPENEKLHPEEEDIRVYYQASLPFQFPDGAGGLYGLVVMPLLGMGRVQAATATADAIRRWKPTYILLVGIAGGIESMGIRLGDILISNQVVDYELQKLTPKGAEIRWEVHRTDARLLSAITNFAWNGETRVYRPDKNRPERHIGPIASGDKVIALDAVLAQYRSVWPKLIGVEMEAAGAAAAAFQAADRPGFFMIRAVSDLADHNKDSAEVKWWRGYACDAAAAFTIAWLKSGPVQSKASAAKSRAASPRKKPAQKSREAPALPRSTQIIYLKDAITLADGLQSWDAIATFLEVAGQYLLEENPNHFSQSSSSAAQLLIGIKQTLPRFIQRQQNSRDMTDFLIEAYSQLAFLVDMLAKMGDRPMPADFFSGIYRSGRLLLAAAERIRFMDL